MGDESAQSLILKGFVSNPLPTRSEMESMATFDLRMILAAPLTSALINNPVIERYNPLFIFLPEGCQLSGFSLTFAGRKS